MLPAPIPVNEKERLASLYALNILDTPAEKRFDRITSLATYIFKVPISTVTLVDSNREWFKSVQGLPKREGSRAISFCGHAMLADDVFIIPDTLKDPRFADNPMVVGEPFIRFYAGVALSASDGQKIGTFCIKDKKPRNLGVEEIAILKDLAAWAELELNVHELDQALQAREKAEKELKENAQILEAFLHSIGEGVVVTDPQGKVILINQVVTNIVKYEQQEILGKVWAKDLPQVEDDQGRSVLYEETPIYLALHNQGTTSKKFWYVGKDQKKVPVIVTGSPVIIKGKNQGAIVVFRDETKETEVDRMKTEFISLASHQLRTPLTSIKWFVELLNETKMDNEQQEFSKNIALSTERMIALVNSLLNVSRIESGRIVINPTPTNLGELVKDVVTDLRQKIDEKKLSLSINIAENLSDINIDPQLIREVYANLLTNAVKYTPVNGKIAVSLLVKGQEVISEIADSGIGIPLDDKNKVFAKFYRSAEAIKLEPNGNGLGLYLAKAIVESSQGKIWFDSRQGSTFSFSLPLTGSEPQTGEILLDS